MSGYDEFLRYLFRVDRLLLRDLKTFFSCKNLWGDFEYNLAYLSRERLMEIVDISLPELEPDDEEFTIADYEISLEQATDAVWRCTKELKYRFHKWIRTLYLPKGHKWEMLELNRDAVFITFNYTDFLESLYGIPPGQIIYLHGNKNDKLGSLVLGHGQDPEKNFENWYYKNKNRKRFRPVLKNKRGRYFPNNSLTYLAYFNEQEEEGNWRHSTRYYATDRLVGEIESYYEESHKNLHKVFEKYQEQFLELKDVKKIVIMGHSLSEVDLPYFKRICEVNAHLDELSWEISYFSDRDQLNINRFLKVLGIERSKVSLFRLADRKIHKRATHLCHA